MRTFATILTAITLCAFGFAQNGNPLPTGRVLPKVACLADPAQTYALYLPSTYKADRKWPAIFIFEPLARGSLPVGLMQEAAERNGFVLLASNNSKNGPLRDSFAAIQTLWHDAHERFSIDDRRLYFAGFSGGARAAIALANTCRGCVAGVIESGAGFSTGLEPAKSVKVPVYITIGEEDFNYPEILQLEPKLQDAGFTFHVRRFDGSHQWPSPEVWQEAFAWLNLQAMKTGALPKEQSAIDASYKADVSTATKLAADHKDYEAWRAYQQTAMTFAGLTDITEAQKQAALLARSKTVRDAQKRELEAASLQMQWAAPISAQVHGLANSPNDHFAKLAEIRNLFEGLSRQARNSKSGNSVVAKRAFAQELAETYELGAEMLESGHYDTAIALYEVIAQNGLHPWGAHLQKARAYAGLKNRAKALAEIRESIKLGLKEAYSLDQPEFAIFTGDNDFKALLDSLHQTRAE